MTQEEYQELKRRERQLEDELEAIEEQTQEFAETERKKKLNSLVGHCYNSRRGSKCFMFDYIEEFNYAWCIDVDIENNAICLASDMYSSPEFLKNNEISREEFLRDYCKVLINIEEHLKNGLSATGEE